MTYTITKSKETTKDGYKVYSFAMIPQGYIKIDGLFKISDAEALKTAKKLAPEADFIIEVAK